MWRFMANYDLLLTPTLAVPAFPLYMQGPEIIEGKMVTLGRLAVLHLHLQSDRTAGRDHSGGLHQGRACRSACRSSVATWRTAPCSPPPALSNKRVRGPTYGRNSWATSASDTAPSLPNSRRCTI